MAKFVMNQKSVKREVVKIRDRILEVCSHGECELNRIWDYPTCWKHLTTSEKAELRERLANAVRSKEDLAKLVLTGADLSGFDFSGIDLSEVFFNSCNLSKCKFVDANLTKAFLGGANLERADLTRAKMHGTVLSGTKLKNVKLLAYSIRHGKPPVNISIDCFGENGFFKRPQIDEKEPYFATATYQSLKNYFLL
ncbi:MAG: pentapeptide repeat-containing protein, partial [bacterium]